jgi:3-hydroxyacyl-CoA dehydrogenase
MALGGGCEICLHSDAIQAHAETYIGLVETGVGLIPGWGGCKEMLLRAAANPTRPQGPMPVIAQVFETVSVAKVSRSAAEAKDLLFLRPDDGITMNRDRLLADAKAKCLELAEGYQPPKPVTLHLPGETAAAGLGLAVHDFINQGKATRYDGIIAGELATVLSGGKADFGDEVTEDQILGLERAAFMRLVKNGSTLARIEHTLETGKPLRN